MVLTILLLTILLTNLMTLLLLEFLAGPNCFVGPHCLNIQSRVQDLLLTNSTWIFLLELTKCNKLKLMCICNISFSSYEQLIRISNFYNEIFVYLLFELFYKIKVSIEVKIHHKEPIIKRLKTPYLVKKPQKVNKQKFRCKTLRFVLVVCMSWTRYTC